MVPHGVIDNQGYHYLLQYMCGHILVVYNISYFCSEINYITINLVTIKCSFIAETDCEDKYGKLLQTNSWFCLALHVFTYGVA